MRRLSKDFWVGLVMLTGSAIYWMGAGSIPISPLDGEVNAAAMPRFLATLLAILSVLLMARALLLPPPDASAGESDKSYEATADQEKAGSDSSSGQSAMYQHMRAGGLIVIGALYLVVLPYLGYLISVALLVAAVSAYMGERPSLKMALIAIALAIGYQLFFVQLLHIQLPAGLLGQLKLF